MKYIINVRTGDTLQFLERYLLYPICFGPDGFMDKD